MLSNEFKINEVAKYVYVKNIYKGHVIICLYVDNILILDSNDHMIKSTKKMLTNKFDMKDLGIINIILGVITHFWVILQIHLFSFQNNKIK